MKPIDIGMIQARRRMIGEKIDDHRKAMSELENELAEIEVAERVFARLSLETAIEQLSDDHDIDEKDASKGKPPGTPEVTEMIKEALTNAVKLGSPGLKPSGMASYIRGKWWPTVAATSIGPIAWRMLQRGDLEKHGSLYCLPKQKGIAVSASVAVGPRC